MNGMPRLPASSTFERFLAPGLDRCAFISDWLRDRGIPHTVVELAGKRHIVIRFGNDAYDQRFRMKTLVAHYDRAPGTPGANDNSAACFQLMQFAERLSDKQKKRSADAQTAHNIRIIFTDGEEAAGTNGIAGQGSFALASGLRKLKMTDDDVYVFDACGRGNTLVLSTAGLENIGQGREASHSGKIRKPQSAFASRLDNLHERVWATARNVLPEKSVQIHTPYSDNAGFLAAGIAAQVITVLPHKEAVVLTRALADNAAGEPEGSELRKMITGNRYPESGSPAAATIPETWRLMHTPDDAARTLTAEAFSLVARFLDAIASRMECAD